MNTPINSVLECSNCNAIVHRQWFIFIVRFRSIYRRLCVTCVIKHYPRFFCPTCFDLFETLPPVHDRAICHKCSSISHANCISASENRNSYACPPCANPNYMFFEITDRGEEKTIDKKAATLLLCAARIATMSNRKMMMEARAKAEERSKDCLAWDKKISVALKHLNVLEKRSGSGSGSGSTQVQGKAKILSPAIRRKMVEHNEAVLNSVYKFSSNFTTLVKRNQNQIGNSRIIEAREKERILEEIIKQNKAAVYREVEKRLLYTER